MKRVKLNENSLGRIISESIRRILSETENGGWVVETDEAEKAYDFFVQEMGGNEEADRAIVRAMSNETLSQILAYLFRMYNLRGWEEYRDSEI